MTRQDAEKLRAALIRIARLTYLDVLPTDSMIDIRFLAETTLASIGDDPGGPFGTVKRRKDCDCEPR